MYRFGSPARIVTSLPSMTVKYGIQKTAGNGESYTVSDNGSWEKGYLVARVCDDLEVYYLIH